MRSHLEAGRAGGRRRDSADRRDRPTRFAPARRHRRRGSRNGDGRAFPLVSARGGRRGEPGCVRAHRRSRRRGAARHAARFLERRQASAGALHPSLVGHRPGGKFHGDLRRRRRALTRPHREPLRGRAPLLAQRRRGQGRGGARVPLEARRDGDPHHPAARRIAGRDPPIGREPFHRRPHRVLGWRSARRGVSRRSRRRGRASPWGE